MGRLAGALRLAERAAQGVVDGVKTYTGKESYTFGDLTLTLSLTLTLT